MLVAAIIGLGTLVVCAVAGQIIQARFRHLLATRHPDTWAKVIHDDMPHWDAYFFALSSECETLGDPQLARLGKLLRITNITALAAALLSALFFFI